MVWKYAIGDACASYHPDLTTMNIIADFALTPWSPAISRCVLQRWVAPRSGKRIYWLSSWYRNPLNDFLNSCCMGRLVVLRWMRAGAEEGPQLGTSWSVDAFKEIVGEMIGDLEGRV